MPAQLWASQELAFERVFEHSPHFVVGLSGWLCGQ
jgi:hypothetical protein